MGKKSRKPAGESAGKSAREKAAEARAKQEAHDKRRSRIINFSVAAGLIVVVVAMVGGAYISSRGSSTDQTQINASAALPPGVLPESSPYAFGFPLYGATAPDSKNVLEIWEDPQCPACAQFEQVFGGTLSTLASTGKVKVIRRTTTFLDKNYPGGHSKAGVSAFGCAIDQGKGEDFWKVMLESQPITEGEGWTSQQFVDIAAEAKVPDQEVFRQCIDSNKYVAWADNSYAIFSQKGIPGTPNLILNGKEVPDTAYASLKAFEDYLVSGGDQATPSPSTSSKKK